MDKHLAMVEALESSDIDLTPWEQDFCESARDDLEEGEELTSRQIDTLEEIYRERVG